MICPNLVLFDSLVTERNPCKNRIGLIFQKLFDNIEVEIDWLSSRSRTEFTLLSGLLEIMYFLEKLISKESIRVERMSQETLKCRHDDWNASFVENCNF